MSRDEENLTEPKETEITIDYTVGEETCLWCGSVENVIFLVNDAWSVEGLCKRCYENIEEECDDEGIDFEEWKESNGVKPIGE